MTTIHHIHPADDAPANELDEDDDDTSSDDSKESEHVDTEAEDTNEATPADGNPDAPSAVRFNGAFVGLSRDRLAAMVCKTYE